MNKRLIYCGCLASFWFSTAMVATAMATTPSPLLTTRGATTAIAVVLEVVAVVDA